MIILTSSLLDVAVKSLFCRDDDMNDTELESELVVVGPSLFHKGVDSI
jgi:hypothetical protein